MDSITICKDTDGEKANYTLKQKVFNKKSERSSDEPVPEFEIEPLDTGEPSLSDELSRRKRALVKESVHGTLTYVGGDMNDQSKLYDSILQQLRIRCIVSTFLTSYINHEFVYLKPMGNSVLVTRPGDQGVQQSPYVTLNFTGLSAKIMTIEDTQPKDTVEFQINDIPSLFSFPSVLHVINQFMIYTDIIEEQYYGGSKLPLLHTLQLNQNLQAVMDTPHYLTVNKSVINSINIRITDREGVPIKFSDKLSNVIIKLHFRKKQ
jgi:hypothetical protein